LPERRVSSDSAAGGGKEKVAVVRKKSWLSFQRLEFLGGAHSSQEDVAIMYEESSRFRNARKRKVSIGTPRSSFETQLRTRLPASAPVLMTSSFISVIKTGGENELVQARSL